MASTLVAEGLIDDIKDWFSGQPVPCVQRLVAEGERVVRRKPCAQAASVLCTSGRGEVVRVPAALIRPGQVQLSFQHVRSHVVKLVDRIAAGNFDVEIPAADSFPGIVGPEGGSVILRDRNHHFAAFLALVGWLSREAAAGRGRPAGLRAVGQRP